MVRELNFRAVPAIHAWTGIFLFLFLARCSRPPEITTVTAVRQDIKVTVPTNGVIEPVNDTAVYAPVDGFVQKIQCSEGEEVLRGQVLLLLDASQARLSLAQARASLLEARRQARAVLAGPSREETDSLDASIKETRLQLQQVEENLSTEEILYRKGAASKEAVENLQERKKLLEARLEALQLNKENLLNRYSEEEKKWERDKLAALADQVRLLERQVNSESVTAAENGILYSLSVKPGSFVTRGQLLARVYRPGQVRLRAYVDEPDLGRIRTGQPVVIEWDGMPDRRWNGTVAKPAEQIVVLNNRSIGHVLCAVGDEPKELLPGVNVRVEIVTDLKENVLVIPRSALFSHDGLSSVLLVEGTRTTVKPVETGVQTYDDVEILSGIEPGASVVSNPSAVNADERI
ncbi:MAG: HlyD family efflux transporter periplasmic adaptor subunit [Acidobacteria bacterium]|nr:HlyD family efflux transporter periplasmic adaptor subunit [Acidobacteriota bacterium]